MLSKKQAASFWINSMYFTLLQRVSLFLFGVVGYMILVRGFSTEINGTWALYITLFSIFEAIKQGLIRNSTIKFLSMPEYTNQAKAVQSSSLIINAAFSLLVIFCLFIFSPYLANLLKSPELIRLLTMSCLLILLLIPFNHCEILLQSKFRFETIFRSAFIRQFIFFGGIFFLYFFIPKSFTLQHVLLVQILSLSIALIFIYQNSHEERAGTFLFSRSLTIRMFHFGKYTFGTNLFAGLSRSFDHFITAGTLTAIEGKNYVAWYNMVARINNMVDVPSLAASDVLYPKNVEALEQEGMSKVKYYFEQVTGTILAFIVPLSLFIFIFPRLLIYIIAGPEYYPAILILQLTILFSMVRPLSYQFGSTLDAIGKPRVNFIANALLMLMNLLLTWIFLHYFGGMGPAYATMVYYTVSLVTMVLLLKKYIQLDFRNVIKYALNRYQQLFYYVFRRGRAPGPRQ